MLPGREREREGKYSDSHLNVDFSAEIILHYIIYSLDRRYTHMNITDIKYSS